MSSGYPGGVGAPTEPLATGWATMGTLVEAIVDRTLDEVIGWVPAEALAWSPPTASLPARITARIQIKYRRAMASAADLRPGETLCAGTTGPGAEAVGPYPDIPDVPVLQVGPRGCRLRGPAVVGEVGALFVSGRDLLRWRQGEVHTTPAWKARLVGEYSSLSTSSVWVPGLEPGGTDAAAYPAGVVARLGNPAGTSSVDLDAAGAWSVLAPAVPGSISLGGAGALPLAYQSQVQAWAAAVTARQSADNAFWTVWDLNPVTLQAYFSTALNPTRAALVAAEASAYAALVAGGTVLTVAL